MKSSAKTPDDYLRQLPDDRRTAIAAVRKVILKNLPKGYEEQMQYGMISYVVPHRLYPAGYHCNPAEALPYTLLGSQKNHMALHLMSIYGNPKAEQWLRKAFADAGKKIDLGKACLRFKKLEDLPLNVIGELIARVPVKKYVACIEASLQQRKAKAAK